MKINFIVDCRMWISFRGALCLMKPPTHLVWPLHLWEHLCNPFSGSYETLFRSLESLQVPVTVLYQRFNALGYHVACER